MKTIAKIITLFLIGTMLTIPNVSAAGSAADSGCLIENLGQYNSIITPYVGFPRDAHGHWSITGTIIRSHAQPSLNYGDGGILNGIWRRMWGHGVSASYIISGVFSGEWH